MNDRDAVVAMTEKMAGVRAAYQAGKSAKAAAAEFEVPYNVARYWLQDIKEPRAGRPRKYVRIPVEQLEYIDACLADGSTIDDARRAVFDIMEDNGLESGQHDLL